MKRENTNKIRFVLEEIVPPFLRDSFLFKFIIRFLYRKDKVHEELKVKAINLSERKYVNYYKKMPKMHNDSDLSEICIKEILKNVIKGHIIDVGCGDGFLLNIIRQNDKNSDLYGSEIAFSSKLKKNFKRNKIKLYKKKIENINQIKIKFDTVICSHVLEHILDINLAYQNLKKICKKRLIIIVPRERPYLHTFNGHLHFFPYTWSLINTIRPKNKFVIKDLDRDLVYIENLND